LPYGNYYNVLIASCKGIYYLLAYYLTKKEQKAG